MQRHFIIQIPHIPIVPWKTEPPAQMNHETLMLIRQGGTDAFASRISFPPYRKAYPKRRASKNISPSSHRRCLPSISAIFKIYSCKKRHKQATDCHVVSYLCLRMPKLAVFAGFVLKQFRMAAEFNDISVIKNCDFITETAGSKPMTDEYSCFIICDFIEMFIYFVF